MSRTTPQQFDRDAIRTQEMRDLFDNVHAWYLSALNNEDVTTDPEDNAYYEGFRSGFESVLNYITGARPGYRR